MQRCHVCGSEIQGNQFVFRMTKTGKYSEGGNYYRNVCLCTACDDEQDRSTKAFTVRTTVLIILTLLVLSGVGIYLHFWS
jgi:hypothetical protein